jgi:hypothetical protein
MTKGALRDSRMQHSLLKCIAEALVSATKRRENAFISGHC